MEWLCVDVEYSLRYGVPFPYIGGVWVCFYTVIYQMLIEAKEKRGQHEPAPFCMI